MLIMTTSMTSATVYRVTISKQATVKQHRSANKLFGHHSGMEDVLQGCGDACGSFCTAYYFFAWGQLPPLPLKNNAPEPSPKVKPVNPGKDSLIRSHPDSESFLNAGKQLARRH